MYLPGDCFVTPFLAMTGGDEQLLPYIVIGFTGSVKRVLTCPAKNVIVRGNGRRWRAA
jgi:hypothetical protein